uniref:Uncharacterized protein n=2 Tax=Anguilla anguilla TaxID=7936 RepID=A0A0E9XY76_ANGAN
MRLKCQRLVKSIKIILCSCNTICTLYKLQYFLNSVMQMYGLIPKQQKRLK